MAQFVFAACLFLIQGVYSQIDTPTPIDPAWATTEFTCGLFSNNFYHVKYSSASFTDQTKLLCGYTFFRDFLSIFYSVIFVYMFVLMVFGLLPTYSALIKGSINAIVWFVSAGYCTWTCADATPKPPYLGNSVWFGLQMVIFFVLGGAVVVFIPEFALVYHGFIDVFVLGGSRFQDECGSMCSMCCCAKDLQDACCVNVVAGTEPLAGGKIPIVSQQNPSASAAGATSMFNDPLSLRPRIQHVTKYKPVPMGPPNA